MASQVELRRKSIRRLAGWATVLFSLLLALESLAFAPNPNLFEISAKDFDEGAGQITLPTQWQFKAGDDPAFAAVSFDDSSWKSVDTRLRAKDRPAEWDGLGWFRLHLRISPSLHGKPLGLTVRQFGAVEIFLDGEPLYAIGKADRQPEDAIPSLQRHPYLFSFDDREVHVLAFRYSNHEPETYERVGKIGGFRVVLGEANQEVDQFAGNLRSLSAYQAFFTGLFAAFALLHWLFYAFYRDAEENLYFGLLSATVALLVYLFFRGHFTTDPGFFQFYDRAMNAAWILLSIAALRFVYGIYSQTPGKLYPVLAAMLALVIPGWIWPMATQPWVFLVLLLAIAEMVRVVIIANLRGQAGARLVGLGIVFLAIGMSIGLFANLGALPPSIVTVFLIPFGSVLALILTMSVYLSRSFAHTSLELRAQLLQVRELSDHKLDQERRAREDELERRLLAAENQRQAEELEDARKLQLSMLPAQLPVLPDLDIAAGMFTATEVGGDYYDFTLERQDSLTVAIGDATGHGLKAGTLVTATKSLFKALVQEDELPDALGRFSRALKLMNLKQLCMALTLVRFQRGQVRLAAGGMPPALVHRAISGDVETIGSAGVPLGSLAEFPYQQNDFEMQAGDTMLLMSDGFPERLNRDDEMLGYDQAREAFAQVATASPQIIIDRLVAVAESWSAGRPAADDTTFVVLKMRARSAER